MEINTRKIKAYIGFAIKSRKIKFGVDDIIKLKNAELIIKLAINRTKTVF